MFVVMQDAQKKLFIFQTGVGLEDQTADPGPEISRLLFQKSWCGNKSQCCSLNIILQSESFMSSIKMIQHASSQRLLRVLKNKKLNFLRCECV